MHAMRTILLTALIGGLAAAETVIVNAANGATEISKDDLAAMFDGKKANWDNGSKVVIVTNDGAVLEPFLKSVVGKTQSQFNAAWKKLVFTGKASAPVVAKSDADAVAEVAKSPGAIGVVSDATAAGAGVKVIAVK
jgi:ABC-type phosphate transport system substrate-binding protein